MQKQCKVCQEQIIKIPKISKKQWENKKYCSWKCRAIGVGVSLKGKYNPLYDNRIAWNKGIACSEETKKKISLSKMGKSYLKGTKRSMDAWNKGKYEMHKCKGCNVMVRKWETYCSYECYNRNKPEAVKLQKKCVECGKDFEIGLSNKKQICCSEKCGRSYAGKSRMGKNHFNWQGGLTLINYPIRQAIMATREYKLWRKSVYERDSYQCQICGSSKSGTLHANHIKRFIDNSELRLNISNGITLCKNCHEKKVTSHESDWESYFIFNLKSRGFIEDEYIRQNMFRNGGLDG